MKLWRVTAEIEFVVAAEDWSSAYSVANDSWHEVRREQEPFLDVDCEIKEEKQLPPEWTIECIPYGDADDKEIGEYLDNVVFPDTKTIDMFEVKE